MKFWVLKIGCQWLLISAYIMLSKQMTLLCAFDNCINFEVTCTENLRAMVCIVQCSSCSAALSLSSETGLSIKLKVIEFPQLMEKNPVNLVFVKFLI